MSPAFLSMNLQAAGLTPLQNPVPSLSLPSFLPDLSPSYLSSFPFPLRLREALVEG